MKKQHKMAAGQEGRPEAPVGPLIVPVDGMAPRPSLKEMADERAAAKVAVVSAADEMATRWASEVVAQLIPVADALWRAKQKLGQVQPEELPHQLRNLGRNVEAGWDGMIAAGFEIQDHTGSPYIDGLPTEVMAFQPMDGLGSRVVIETLKPTLFFRDQLVRRGQIIVGIPKDATV